MLRSKGVAPDYVAGTVWANTPRWSAAGSLDFADAVRLVKKRGRYMQEAVPPALARWPRC